VADFWVYDSQGKTLSKSLNLSRQVSHPSR
jgi:hypothetical protein